MRDFSRRRPQRAGDVSVSLKVRVISGCFHREHSPRAYESIDSFLIAAAPDVDFVEHESGPELLVYLAAATAGISLAKSVLDLITTILRARSEGTKKGDRPDAPLELIIRRMDTGNTFHEEMVLRIGHGDPVDPEAIEKRIAEALDRLLKKPDVPAD